MPTLADIKLMTRDEAETLINTVENTATYTYEGWGSKFKLQDFTQTSATAAGTYYPDEGYLGFGSVTTVDVGGTPQLEDKEFTANGVYTPATGKDGYRNVTVNVPITGDSYMPYFDQTALLEGTETTTFKVHANRTDVFGPNTWLPGADYSLHNLRATIDGTDYDYVSVEIQSAWQNTDFDSNGNVIFRLTGNYKAYSDSTHTTILKEGTNFSMVYVYNRMKAEQAASAQPTDPYIRTSPADWKCSCYTYHQGEVITNLPVQELDNYKALIYFKVN